MHGFSFKSVSSESYFENCFQNFVPCPSLSVSLAWDLGWKKNNPRLRLAVLLQAGSCVSQNGRPWLMASLDLLGTLPGREMQRISVFTIACGKIHDLNLGDKAIFITAQVLWVRNLSMAWGWCLGLKVSHWIVIKRSAGAAASSEGSVRDEGNSLSGSSRTWLLIDRPPGPLHREDLMTQQLHCPG